jgi:Ca-activated chloride channel family protein
VPLTVTNRNGKAVAGLEGSQFRVLDNGESRPVVSFERDQRPLSVVVVVDTSTSMGSNMEQTRLALRNFMSSAGPLDEAALLTFSDHLQLVNGFTHDFAALMSNLKSERGAGYTTVSDALCQALQVARGGHNPRKALLVITDGDDNYGRNTSELMTAVRESDTQVYGVVIHYQSFSMKRFGNGLLEGLAKASGGSSFEIGSPKRLPETVDKIADATRSLYHIGFIPSSVDNGGRWHKIQVRPADPNLGSLRIYAKNAYKPS